VTAAKHRYRRSSDFGGHGVTALLQSPRIDLRDDVHWHDFFVSFAVFPNLIFTLFFLTKQPK